MGLGLGFGCANLCRASLAPQRPRRPRRALPPVRRGELPTPLLAQPAEKVVTRGAQQRAAKFGWWWGGLDFSVWIASEQSTELALTLAPAAHQSAELTTRLA